MARIARRRDAPPERRKPYALQVYGQRLHASVQKDDTDAVHLAQAIALCAPLVTVVRDLFAILAGAFAIITYWRNAKVRRAEWLSDLHSKFFEAETYKQIRSVLEGKGERWNNLAKAISDNQTNEDVELFVDYLNFFEFVAGLQKLGQLSIKEIEQLFDYYLRQLAGEETVRNFVSTQGFESLQKLFAQLSDQKGRAQR